MAVPGSSGTPELSMLKLAREAKHGAYTGSQSMGVIHMYDLMNGGNTNGSTVSDPTLNTACDPNPDDCAGTEQYATLSGENPSGGSITVYYRSDIYSSASDFANSEGAVAYSNNTGSARHSAGDGYVFIYSGCSNEVNLNSNGQSTYTEPIC